MKDTYRALVLLAQGCEEVEAVTVIDVLNRAHVEVISAGLQDGPVMASHGATLLPDMTLDKALAGEYDMVVLPGGMPGTDMLAEDERVIALIEKMNAAGKFVAAICAAPRILAQHGLLNGKRATAYPGFLEQKQWPAITCTGKTVEWDGNIITSRSAGTAILFALTLVEALAGEQARRTVEDALVCPLHAAEH